MRVLNMQTELSDMLVKDFINIIIGKLFDHYPNKSTFTTPLLKSQEKCLIFNPLTVLVALGIIQVGSASPRRIPSATTKLNKIKNTTQS